jgi:excisionase family DNA binding protein
MARSINEQGGWPEQLDLLRVREVAERLGVTPSRVYQLTRSGEIPSVRVGGALRIPREAWEEWLDRQRDRALKALREPPEADSGAGE